MPTAVTDFALTLPGTDEPLPRREDADQYMDGIWRLIRPSRQQRISRFAAEYAAVRSHEHRTPRSAEAIQALPYDDTSGEHQAMWQQRAHSFDQFCLAISDHKPRQMVDVGAGCCWLSARLMTDGWSAAAVDVTVDGGDGLASARLLPSPPLLAQAEMEALPFGQASVDLVVLNAALHYASNVVGALQEAARVLRPGGTLAVLDSPVFDDADAGHRMVADFARGTLAELGVSAAEHLGPGFVTEHDLATFSQLEQATWTRHDSSRSITGRVRAKVGARRAGREIAKRPLLVATMPAVGPRRKSS